MANSVPSPSESGEPESDSASDPQGTAGAVYQLTIKRGFLVLCIMFVSQTLAGIGLSYGAKLIWGRDGVDLPTIGVLSVLLGGTIVLLWAWADIRRFGPSFLPQIGWRQGVLKTSQVVVLVLLLLGVTHFLAWTYRSVLLPQWGHGGVVGGGSQMFAHIKETGSALKMTGFLILALLVGPVMEEVVFRGYLQSSLARRLPVWSAIVITSVLFMLGHGPAILWPMYFLYSLAWGWVFVYTRSIKASIAIHILSNLFYTVVALMEWDILA
ncbi:CPBP family intramembrane glutamic endopeptidase [Pelagicoccus mobilis]|uniref:CPBP family intramembrane metalloprotease n=1 Tax=Pelagicoccus mobilis TaxID=415221 RepID=A0A934VNB9_9BACT|nr:CPBP family intramembrane glutamic endopeptidase [Pelagicoccus mobilis]MBK1876067.1 CPBP family intramembrane metalloprotease [Pelagicoccus mobilis]